MLAVQFLHLRLLVILQTDFLDQPQLRVNEIHVLFLVVEDLLEKAT